MRGLRTFFTLSLLLWISACSIPSSLLTPTPTPFVFPTEFFTPVPSLTVEQVKNAEYTITGYDVDAHAYRFVDGAYKQGADTPNYADLRLLDFYPFGDLNEDGAADAAVLIAENYGGTGVFVSLAAVVNDAGQPRHAVSTRIDDRPQIDALEIRNGEIFLDAVIHSFEDPGCCPTFEVTRTYKLIGPALVLVNATSRTPAGLTRSITIELPLEGADANGPLIVSGQVSVAPFENNLAFRAYNEEGNELSSGPVTVTASDLGAPGTFNFTLDLTTFPPGRLYIELADFSAADGSVFALDTVMVIVR